MRLGGDSIIFSFFSERHVAAMPLDETILSVRWVAAASHFRSCLSHTSRVYCLMNINYVFNVMHVRVGIIIPFLCEGHAAVISLEKSQLCMQWVGCKCGVTDWWMMAAGF